MLHIVLLQIESGIFSPNIIKIGQHLTQLLLKRVPFLKHCWCFALWCFALCYSGELFEH